VASPEKNGLAELLSDFNADGDPCIKPFVCPLVMWENPDQAGFSSMASPVVTDNLASARLIRPEECALRGKFAVVPEMSF